MHLVPWESYGWVGTQLLCGDDIWPTACPCLYSTTWVSRPWGSDMVPNIQCLIYVVRYARFTTPKADFVVAVYFFFIFVFFPKAAVKVEFPEIRALESLSFQGKFCLAFLKNCSPGKSRKPQTTRCIPFSASIFSLVTVLSHLEHRINSGLTSLRKQHAANTNRETKHSGAQLLMTRTQSTQKDIMEQQVLVWDDLGQEGIV